MKLRSSADITPWTHRLIQNLLDAGRKTPESDVWFILPLPTYHHNGIEQDCVKFFLSSIIVDKSVKEFADDLYSKKRGRLPNHEYIRHLFHFTNDETQVRQYGRYNHVLINFHPSPHPNIYDIFSSSKLSMWPPRWTLEAVANMNLHVVEEALLYEPAFIEGMIHHPYIEASPIKVCTMGSMSVASLSEDEHCIYSDVLNSTIVTPEKPDVVDSAIMANQLEDGYKIYGNNLNATLVSPEKLCSEDSINAVNLFEDEDRDEDVDLHDIVGYSEKLRTPYQVINCDLNEFKNQAAGAGDSAVELPIFGRRVPCDIMAILRSATDAKLISEIIRRSGINVDHTVFDNIRNGRVHCYQSLSEMTAKRIGYMKKFLDICFTAITRIIMPQSQNENCEKGDKG